MEKFSFKQNVVIRPPNVTGGKLNHKEERGGAALCVQQTDTSYSQQLFHQFEHSTV